MKEISNYRLREDVKFIKLKKKRNEQAIYLLKHPDSGEIFEFGEKEYWLCRILDNRVKTPEIFAQFYQDFNQYIDQEFIHDFYQTLSTLNLLDNNVLAPFNDDSLESEAIRVNDNSYDSNEPPAFLYHPAPKTETNISSKSGKYVLFKPDFGLKILNSLAPHPLIIISLFILIFMISSGILLKNKFLFWQDFIFFAKPIPLVTKAGFAWIFVNLLSQIASGSVYTHYGGIVKEFGLQLILGLIPVFYISPARNKEFTRREKLWIFAAPLLFRVFLLNLGIITWFIFRETKIEIATFALILSHISLISLVLNSNPFWQTPGYLWLTTYLKDPQLKERSLLILQSKFTPNYLPINLSNVATLKFKFYAIMCLVFVILIPGLLLLATALFLGAKLRITGLIIFLILGIPVWRWYRSKNIEKNHNKSKFSELKMNEKTANNSSKSLTKRIPLFVKQNYLKIAVTLGLLMVLNLPYQYRPGGNIKLLPPQEKEIQADISGKITKVTVKGGDGSWLKYRTIIAEINPSRQLNFSTPIDNDRLVKLEEINYQKHLQQKAQAKLEELLSTPRPESVTVAQRELEIAQQESEKATSELNSAQNEITVAQSQLKEEMVRLDFRQREASRLEELYQQGAIPLQEIEDAQRQAQISQVEVETRKNNVETQLRKFEEEQKNINIKTKEIEREQANLALVMSGPNSHEIEAARKDIEAIGSEIRRLNQQLNNTKQELQGRKLLMPFDGYIITPYLEQKVGTYLEQGETFAIAENSRKITAEIEVAESDAGEFALGARTEIKLTAYPKKKIIGEVINIEPVAKEESNGNFIKVLVEIPNGDGLLKSGMSGYAKIDGKIKPLGVVIFRPIIRFVEIEVWSWIP
jgi:multidrug resistance efflux pump